MADELPAIAQGWREQYERRKAAGLASETDSVSRRGDGGGGVSFQIPTGWDDGSGKIRHVKSGPFKGRVCFSSRREAQDIAKRVADQSGVSVRYDPN